VELQRDTERKFLFFKKNRVHYTAKVEKGSNVAVFGLGGVGLSAIMVN
jgi:D-arabinose 1-dehydrogenase-like Zn-dependent alcohol dehydrogenase